MNDDWKRQDGEPDSDENFEEQKEEYYSPEKNPLRMPPEGEGIEQPEPEPEIPSPQLPEQEKEDIGKSRTPWDRRDETGTFEAFWETWKTILFRPGEFFRHLSPAGGFRGPLLFFIIFIVLFAVLAFPANLLDSYLTLLIQKPLMEFQKQLVESQPSSPLSNAFAVPSSEDVHWTGVLLRQVIFTFISPFAGFIGIFISSAIYAVLGMLFIRRVDYELVFRCLAFCSVSSTTMIVNPIPILREIIVFAHSIILMTLAFKHVGGISGGKAFLWAILPIVFIVFLACCCCCGISAILGFISA